MILEDDINQQNENNELNEQQNSQNEFNEQQNEQQNFQDKKPSKLMTPYIAFMKNYKSQQGGLGLKEMSNIWNQMPPEQRQVYIQIAENDKERFQKENQDYIEYKKKTQDQPQDLEEIDQDQSKDIAFPISRIKYILKSDEQNRVLKKNVVLMMEQATELFGEYIINQSVQNMKENNRKKLQSSDICNDYKIQDEIIKRNHNLKFLESTGIIQKIQEVQKSPQKIQEPIQKQKLQPIPKNNKTLDLYFKKV